MNTQTHVLLALAVIAPALATPSAATRVRPPLASGDNGTRLITASVIIGALLPDASLFVMFAFGKLAGVSDAVLWGEWYYAERWQALGAISNSIPLYASAAGLAWWRGARPTAGPLPYRMLLSASCAALLHAVADLPLHHDDGHAHFWPFSDWIFASPVSYWDPAHHGRAWSIIECALAAALIGVLWMRRSSIAWRVALVLAGASYAIVAYWWALGASS